MAKAKKIKKVSEPTTLTNEELTAVKQHLARVEELKTSIGDLEVQKGAAMSAYLQVAASFRALQKELEDKYGSISVDTVTGIYKEVEKEDVTN